MVRICVAVIFVLSIGTEICLGVSPVVAVKAGVGYDLLSQEYFLDSAVNAGPDSILVRLALKTTYLDDIKARLDLNVTHPNRRSYSFRSTYEQTRELIRVRLNSDWRPTVGPIGLEWRSQADWRTRYRDSARVGDAYFSGNSSLRARYSLSSSLTTFAQAQGDFIVFEEPTQYIFDYRRLGGKIGAEHLSGHGLLAGSVFAIERQVPDSQSLDYITAGVDLGWLAGFGWLDFDLYGRVDRRDYQRPGGQDDYTRLELISHLTEKAGSRYLLRQELEARQFLYSAEDLLNADFLEVAGAAQIGYQFDGLTAFLGPEGRLLEEQDKAEVEGSDYAELGVRCDLDLLHAALLGSATWSFGRRDLALESSGQSDFFYQRLNLLFDWTLFERWSLSIFGAAEWEWHDDRDDNSQLYLLSSTLSYSF